MDEAQFMQGAGRLLKGQEPPQNKCCMLTHLFQELVQGVRIRAVDIYLRTQWQR